MIKRATMHRKLAIACGVAALVAGRASATEVIAYTETALDASDPIQSGRLTRARPPSSWADTVTFPGFINADTPYQYRAVDVSFAANALQDVYYEITVDDPDAAIFASAYGGGYNSKIPDAGYLGDEGSSGNYFPGDPSFFQVVVPQGQRLSLVFNSVGVANTAFAYQVSAYSDTMYDEDFKAGGVPEPAGWALLVVGFGAIGAAMRRARVQGCAIA